MSNGHRFSTSLLAGCLALLTASAHAQGRATGIVKDEAGQGLKGATVVAENPNASPKSFTTTTDDRGRFSMIGMSSGIWTLTASAPGFVPTQTAAQISVARPNSPFEFKLSRGAAGAISPLAGLNVRDLQTELQAAGELYQAAKWDEALAVYKSIMAKAEFLTTVNLQIGNIYRMKKDYEKASAAYQEVLKSDPDNSRAKVALEQTAKAQGRN